MRTRFGDQRGEEYPEPKARIVVGPRTGDALTTAENADIMSTAATSATTIQHEIRSSIPPHVAVPVVRVRG
jgi:hypothetical protein